MYQNHLDWKKQLWAEINTDSLEDQNRKLAKQIRTYKASTSNIYQCPVYKTLQRGPTFVFVAQLKTKSPPARWTLAGVALVMDIVS